MFRLDIDFFPLLILVPAIVQFTICLLAGKKMRFYIGILPFAFLSFAGYGYLADRAWNLPYPGLFEPDFMMSSATAGFLAFGAMFIGTILGTILWAIFRKIFGGSNDMCLTPSGNLMESLILLFLIRSFLTARRLVSTNCRQNILPPRSLSAYYAQGCQAARQVY